MKIYFEDGELYRPNSINFTYDYLIDARYGYTSNDTLLRAIRTYNDNSSVYTNSIIALSNIFAWNKELEVPEIYLVRDGKFVRIDELTNKWLRESHNIMKLYMAGHFDSK